MVNLEHKLTVDDLIVEYMMYKVKNGYEPSFLTSEFINFLCCFELKMPVYDALYDGEELFKRFFERKNKYDWTIYEKVKPHMDIIYSEENKDYLIKANNKLSDFDRSVINTYFMDNGMGKYDDFKGEVFKIRSIIGEYLTNQPKRRFDENIKISKNDLKIGKLVAVGIISNIWENYIEVQISYHNWPKQCTDMGKYLFDIDLAEIIGVKSIKSKLIELYDVFSRRVAILYHQDRKLKISTYTNSYLARSNYDLLIQGYEDIMKDTFGTYKKALDINLDTSTFEESHEIGGVYYYDDDPDVKTTIKMIGNNNSKKLVKQLDNIKG